MEQDPIGPLLAGFAPITLEEMDNVKLQMRVDTKYMFAEKELPEILRALRPDYRVLEVNGERGTRYRSLYLDTPGLQCYLEHHNGRVFRNKIRYREYVGSHLRFLEVKRKTGRGDTDKARMRVDAVPDVPPNEHLRFITQHSTVRGELVPELWNEFTRITFVHRTRHERLTIDRGLRFSRNGVERSLDGICVAELKGSRADGRSPFIELMRARRIRESGMSKYCAGMIALGLAPKQNTFKPLLLRIEALRAA